MDVIVLSGLVHIEKLQKFLQILNGMSSDTGVTIQALNCDRIAGRKHVEFAAKKALRAMEKGTNVAKDPGIEIMRYAAGKRQIGDSFSMGLHEGENRAAFVLVGPEDAMKRAIGKLSNIIDERPLLEYSPEKKKDIVSQFDITEQEIDAVGQEKIPELVIERVALVDVLK